MHKQMMVMIPNGNHPQFCEIFGYATRGIPGLEVVGLGARGKSVKEKFIYFNKRYKLSLPPKRFVLCVDDQFVMSNKDSNYRWLELPFLIMYWSMAGILPIQNLNNCLCSGTISATGKIETLPLDFSLLEALEHYFSEGYKLISKFDSIAGTDIIPIEEIIKFPKVSA